MPRPAAGRTALRTLRRGEDFRGSVGMGQRSLAERDLKKAFLDSSRHGGGLSIKVDTVVRQKAFPYGKRSLAGSERSAEDSVIASRRWVKVRETGIWA